MVVRCSFLLIDSVKNIEPFHSELQFTLFVVTRNLFGIILQVLHKIQYLHMHRICTITLLKRIIVLDIGNTLTKSFPTNVQNIEVISTNFKSCACTLGAGSVQSRIIFSFVKLKCTRTLKLSLMTLGTNCK